MAAARNTGRSGTWTPERLIAALHEAERTLGRKPSQIDFDPSHARRLGHTERAELAERLIDSGEWPAHHTFRDHFGSWNGALVAAGYKPRGLGAQGQMDDAYIGGAAA